MRRSHSRRFFQQALLFMPLLMCAVLSTGCRHIKPQPVCSPQAGVEIVTAAEALIRRNSYPPITCQALLERGAAAVDPSMTIGAINRDRSTCDPAEIYRLVLQHNPGAACEQVAWDLVAGMVTGLDPYSRYIPGAGQMWPARGKASAQPVLKWETLADHFRYVRISEFEPALTADLWHNLATDPPDGLIIDLRNCGGGSLEAGLACANLFVSEGVLAILKGSHARANRTVRAKPLARKFTDLPLVILIDRRTASVAEAFSAALQSHGRATLVGRPSHGKGSVQANIPLQNGGRLRLTIAHLFTPDAEPLQGRGVVPDVLIAETGQAQAQHPEKGLHATGRIDLVRQAVMLFNQTN